MSYTYRTDKLLDAIGNAQGLVNQRNCPKQWVGFAIELETELQEATFEIERLRKANLQLQESAEQQKQRIKRLEEALTEIELAMKQPASNHRFMQIAGPARQVINIIKKAKEAKP